MDFSTRFRSLLTPEVTIYESFIASLLGSIVLIKLIINSLNDAFILLVPLLIFLFSSYITGQTIFFRKERSTMQKNLIYVLSIPLVFLAWSSYLIILIPKFSDPTFSLYSLHLNKYIMLIISLAALIKLMVLFLFSGRLKIRPLSETSINVHPLVLVIIVIIALYLCFSNSNLIIGFSNAFITCGILLSLAHLVPVKPLDFAGGNS